RLSSGRAVATIDRGMRPGRRPMLAARMPRLALDLVRLARPYDWAKSVFVLLPVPFALRAGASLSLGTFALGVAAFSLVASVVCVLIDLRDAEADRAHPTKRSRPIASGAVSPGVAVVWGVALLAAAFGLAAATGHRAVVDYLLVYVAMNAFYTLAGKQIP